MPLQKYTIGKDWVSPIATPHPEKTLREEIEIGIKGAAGEVRRRSVGHLVGTDKLFL